MADADRFCDIPVGFVGWAENYDRKNKIYAANVCQSFIQEHFSTFASKIPIEILKLTSKQTTNLTDVFFKVRRSFSYFFSHDDFMVSPMKTDFTLLDLLNFVPEKDMALISDEHQRNVRKEGQQILLSKFTAAYRGFLSAKVTHGDKLLNVGESHGRRVQIELSLAYGPPDLVLLEEVGVDAPSHFAVPTGNIDFVMFSQSPAIGKYLGIYSQRILRDSVPADLVTPTSTKTSDSYNSPGSDRQVVVELLALSQVLLSSDLETPNVKYDAVILIKACDKFFQPYVYFPVLDILLRPGTDIALSHSEASPHSYLMGSFILYLFLHYQLNKKSFIDCLGVEDVALKSGWEKVYKASGAAYYNYIKPQQRNKRVVKIHDKEEVVPKQRKVTKFDEFKIY